MNEALTVADLLREPLLDGVTVLAGASGIERGVDDVRWQEGPMDDVGGSLLVCEESLATPPYRLDALIRRAEQAGAAALLLVGGGPSRTLLSNVRLADRMRIPVLTLERERPVALLQELTALVRTPELARARTVEHLVHRLGSTRTGQDILTAAGRALGAPLSVVAPDGSCLLGDPVVADDGFHLDRPVPQRGAHLLIHPVLDPDVNRLAAWVACPFDRAASTRLDVLAIGLAVTEPFLRSWLSGRRAQADRDAVFRTHLLAEIVAGGDSVSRDVVQGAVSLGWQLQSWHVGIHVVADAAPDDRGERVAERLTDELRGHGVPAVTAVNRGDGWAVWASTESEPGPEDARRMLRTVRVSTAALPREWGLTAGIGRPHQGPRGLAATLVEARDAADLARSLDFRPAVEHSDELGVARLLATWQRSDVTRAFAESALAPLHDSDHLLQTLRAYLESGTSVVVTAQTLGVHRNTVTTRMQLIRERLGVDLDDPSRRLALQVACRALDT